MVDWRDEFLNESIFYSQRERERERRRARHEQPKPAEPIIYETPFVKHELPECNLMLSDVQVREMPSSYWSVFERVFHTHAKETTQKVNVYNDTRGFSRKIICVEALTIWLPEGTMTIDERIEFALGYKLPHIVLTP